MVTSNNQIEELINSGKELINNGDPIEQSIKKVTTQLMAGILHQLINTSQNNEYPINLIIPLDLDNCEESIFKDMSGYSLKIKLGHKENSNNVELTFNYEPED